MKAQLLATLAAGPATLGDLQRALDVPSHPAARRGQLIALLRALAASGQIRMPKPNRPWYQLRKGLDKA